MTRREQTKGRASGKASDAFTDEERLAMQQRVREMKRPARQGKGADKADGEGEVLAKIASMPEPDRSMAKRIHSIVMASAPDLEPRLWYGMPAYARNGKTVCHFQDAKKFKTRYATLGFSDSANLDDGSVWPVAFALKELNSAAEGKIAALVKKAVS